MNPIRIRLVHQYVRSGKLFVESEADRQVIALAIRLTSAAPKKKKSKGKYIGDIHAQAEAETKETKVVRSLKQLILDEIYAALCKKSQRYRRYVDQVKQNGHLLIGAIAVQVAGHLGMAVGVVAALVAALLRLAFSMGIEIFCKRYRSGNL